MQILKKSSIYFLFALCVFSTACAKESDFSYASQSNGITHILENSSPASPPTQSLAPSENATQSWQNTADLSHIQTTKKLVAFTFDDAPHKNMENILSVFANYNESHPNHIACATFFINSYFLDDTTLPILYTANVMGMELGNHTHSHLDLTTLSKEETIREISITDQLLQKVDGKPYHLLRAPFGRINDTVCLLAHSPIIDWSIDTLDWQQKNTKEICQTVLDNVFDGAIVLMHDGFEGSLNALKILLPALEEKGYQVCSVSQLAKANGVHLKKSKVYVRARKQN